MLSSVTTLGAVGINLAEIVRLRFVLFVLFLSSTIPLTVVVRMAATREALTTDFRNGQRGIF